MSRSVSRSPSRGGEGSPMEGSPKRSSRRGGSVSSRSPSPIPKSASKSVVEVESEERKNECKEASSCGPESVSAPAPPPSSASGASEGKPVSEHREENNSAHSDHKDSAGNNGGDAKRHSRSRSPPFRRSSRSSEKDRPRTRSKTGSPADRKTRSRTGSPRSRSSSRDRRRRDRSFSPARRRSSDRRNSYGRNRSPIDEDGYRIHVADLDISASKRDMEKVFGKFGPLKEIWMARSVPCFAFVVYRYREDAEDAVRSADGVEISGRRIRVTHARPRTKGRGRRGFNPNMRCYQCGDRGHFSRDCPDTKYGYKRPPSPRYSRRDSDRHYDRGGGGGYDRFDHRRSSRY